MKKLKLIVLLLALLGLAVVITHKYMTFQAKDLIFDDLSKIPKNKVGLLLGTSKYTSGDAINLFYKNVFWDISLL